VHFIPLIPGWRLASALVSMRFGRSRNRSRMLTSESLPPIRSDFVCESAPGMVKQAGLENGKHPQIGLRRKFTNNQVATRPASPIHLAHLLNNKLESPNKYLIRTKNEKNRF